MRNALESVLILRGEDRLNSTVNTALSEAERRLKNFSSRAATFGRKALMGGMILAAPLVASTNVAMDFEDQLGNVNTLLDYTPDQIGRMGDEVLALRGIGKPIDELGDSLYDVVSAGIPANQQIEELRQSARLAVTGLSETGEAVDIMTSSANAFAKEGLTAAERANIFFKTVKAGKTTVAALSQAFGATAPIVEAAGVSFREFQASTAAITTLGTPAAQAQNQIQAAVMALQKPTADLTKIFHHYGVRSGPELIKKQGGLVNALSAVRIQAGKQHKSLAKVIGRSEALSATLALTGAANKAYTNTLADMTGGTDAISVAMATQERKAKHSLGVFKNEAVALGIKVGNVLLPVLSDLMGSLSGVMEQVSVFAGNFPMATKVIVITTAVTAAFVVSLGVLGMTASAVGNGLAALTAIYTFMTTRISWATIAQYAYTAAQWLAITAGAGLVVAYFAVATAIEAMRVKQIAAAVATKAVTATQWLWNIALTANPIGIIIVAIGALIGAIVALNVYWDEAVAWFNDLNIVAKVLVVSLGFVIAPVIAIIAAVRALVENWDSVVAFFQNTWQQVVGFFVNIHEGIVGAINDAIDFVMSIPGRMFEAGKNIVNSIADGMKSVATYPLRVIEDVVGGIRDFLPFSPAKRGPLTDIHRVRIVETMAEGMKPGPAIDAMDRVATGIRQRAAAAAPAGGGPGSSLSAPAASGGGSINITIAPNITVSGGSGAETGKQVAQAIIDQLRPELPKLAAMLRGYQEKQDRRAFG